MSACRWVFCLCLLQSLAPLWAGPAFAGFSEPRRVTAPEKTGGTFHVGLDYFGNRFLAHEEDGQMVVEVLGSGISDRTVLGPGSEPRLAFHRLGTFLACSGPGPEAGSRRIHLFSRSGGRWSPLEGPPGGDGEDRHPSLQVTGQEVPLIAWERRPAEGPARVLFRRGGRPVADLGRGERPAVVVDGAGRAHVFFLRDGEIFRARESLPGTGAFAHAVNLTETPFVPESPPSVAVLEGAILFLCFEREGDVLLADDADGSFKDAVRVAGGGARSPALAISPNGALAVVFEVGGDLHATLGAAAGPLPAPTPVLESAAPEADPVVAVDSFANVFVAFRRDEAVHYATDAGPPQAAFEADRLRGEAPLAVQFADRSLGDVTGWSWDFGDGGASRDASPRHVYKRSGEFIVKLRVSGPGGESPISHRKTVLVLDPRNEMRVAPVSVFPGQRYVHVPVLATHEAPAQGFTIAATYDPAILEIQEVKFESSNIAGLLPELFAVTVSDDPVEPYFTAGILFDVAEPYDGRTIPPGTDQRVANVVVHVSPAAAPGTVSRIQLRNQVGRPPLNNIFTVNGFTVLPVLGEGGTVTLRRLRFPPPRFFLRGDTDSSGVVNLTDAVLILNYLFSGGADPACFDAADVSDDGALDVSDPVYLLNFLFKSGSYPPPPYPDPGLDSTDDPLPECRLR